MQIIDYFLGVYLSNQDLGRVFDGEEAKVGEYPVK